MASNTSIIILFLVFRRFIWLTNKYYVNNEIVSNCIKLHQISSNCIESHQITSITWESYESIKLDINNSLNISCKLFVEKQN